MNGDCLICRKHRGAPSPPGGALHEDEIVFASHVFDMQGGGRLTYLGHLIVETKRHAESISELNDDEAAAVGRVAARLSRALRGAGASWVYAITIGHGVPHFHLHLLPRYPDTPTELRFHEVDEWEGAAKGGPEEIADIVARIRAQLP